MRPSYLPERAKLRVHVKDVGVIYNAVAADASVERGARADLFRECKQYRSKIGRAYRDDLGIDGHRAVVAVDIGVDVVGPRRGSRVKRGMKCQEPGGAAITAHRWWWCHLTPVIIIQHPVKSKVNVRMCRSSRFSVSLFQRARDVNSHDHPTLRCLVRLYSHAVTHDARCPVSFSGYIRDFQIYPCDFRRYSRVSLHGKK